MISSIDLFLSRDWGVGFGPAVDAPRLAGLEPSVAHVGAESCLVPSVVEANILGGGPIPNRAADGVGAPVEAIVAELVVALDELCVALPLSA